VKLSSLSFMDGEPMPDRYAFAKNLSPQSLIPGDNMNPQFTFIDVPEDARSLTLLCADLDSPEDLSLADREGITLDGDVPRRPFYHWVLIDLPPDTGDIEEGAYAIGVYRRGKSQLSDDMAAREGLNDLTHRFTNDPEMAGYYYGYDGPCPPWNYPKPHRYCFTLYALDIESLTVPTLFYGNDVVAAMEGHVLACASLTGVYTLDPSVAPVQVGSTTAT